MGLAGISNSNTSVIPADEAEILKNGKVERHVLFP
jgi:hypothetical protein